ncbi:MAG: small multidrug export protein [Ruminococcaceae bacterium]|nr:small multidrug export protein [Oscillospiraceae bacterium]
MVPVIELRGALPMGVAAGLSVPAATMISIIGNTIPVPFILLLLRRVFAWLRSFPKLGGLIDRLERRAHLKGQTVKKYRTLGLFILVAIPLPGTGAWTGALVAGVLDMRIKTALPAIFGGVCVAGLIVALVTAGVIHLF